MNAFKILWEFIQVIAWFESRSSSNLAVESWRFEKSGLLVLNQPQIIITKSELHFKLKPQKAERKIQFLVQTNYAQLRERFTELTWMIIYNYNCLLWFTTELLCTIWMQIHPAHKHTRGITVRSRVILESRRSLSCRLQRFVFSKSKSKHKLLNWRLEDGKVSFFIQIWKHEATF